MRKIDLERERLYENFKVENHHMVRGGQSKYYWATQPVIDNFDKLAQDLAFEKTILEIGCSKGELAHIYSKHAKKYIGVDISDEAIKFAEQQNYKKCIFIVSDAHQLPLEDCSVDLIVVNSLLHHLDLKTSFKEINRVLTKDGKFIFREPLGTNPIFNLYRYFTPKARTPDEKPFDFLDLALIEKYFLINKKRFFGFFSIFSAFIKNSAVRNILTTIDDYISMTPLKYFFWQFYVVAAKKNINEEK